ncbi:MAG: siphovirus Gp157 family protein [Oscillospiraceae bacterium]
MSIKLYELSNSFEELWDNIDILDPEQEGYADFCSAFLTSLEGLENDFEDKAESLAVYIKRLMAERDALAEEAKKITARKKTMENKVDFLKGYLLLNMQKMSLAKIDKPKAVISLRNNPESVKIEDLNAVLKYKQYIKPQKLDEDVIDKTALKKDMQAGDKILGASLVRTKSLSIK